MISYDWYLASLSANTFVNEDQYLIKGDEVGGESNAARAALSSNRTKRLFEGASIFLAGKFSPPSLSRTDLTLLINSGGGRVVARKLKDTDVHGWIVYDPESGNDGSLRWTETYPRKINWSTLLDFISRYKSPFQ